MGEGRSHNFEPNVANCQECHPDIEDFDVNGAQTEITALAEEVAAVLVAKGLLDEEGSPIVGMYPEAEAAALWNYIFVVPEDNTFGVHNSGYAKALLEAALEALQ